jgi:NAD(P)-dependent dehydrogenase (short-subunit alcohol dehydrogenase family)
MPVSLDFSGKCAVVTGGAKGIGLAMARLLSEAGAEVWIFDCEPAPAEFGNHACRVDVTSAAALEVAFAKTGPPDVLMINAGIAPFADLDNTTRETWDRTLTVNLTGAFETLRAAARLMKPRRRGAVVITASTNSFDGEAHLLAYNASKAGMLGLLHTAANELGPWQIRVNAVCPGLIRTRLTETFYNAPGIVREYFRHVPLGRGGEPDEVAAAAVFLASDLASYISGATLFVDGGQMAAKFGTWDEATAEFQRDRWRLKE